MLRCWLVLMLLVFSVPTTVFGVVEDDEEVKALKARFQQEAALKIAKKKQSTDFSATAKLSALEKAAGKRHNPGMTIEEQIGEQKPLHSINLAGASCTEVARWSAFSERFPILKNAPLEGTYAANVKLTFKPLGMELRNVRCMRCREWGHQSGDRECSMRGFNPKDAERVAREDPMAGLIVGGELEGGHHLVLKQGLLGERAPAAASDAYALVSDGEEGVGGSGAGGHGEEMSDEAALAFLNAMTTEEKREFLRQVALALRETDNPH
jgi:hypothetical protein